MAAVKFDASRYDNHCVQFEPRDLNKVTRLADGTDLKVGQLLRGSSAEDVDPCGAGAEDSLYICAGFWDSDGVYSDVPGTAVPDNAEVNCYPLVSGVQFVGLLPNTVTTAIGEKLQCAAAGRVTNLTATATADEVLATAVRALEAVTAAADDDFVLLEVL